MNLNVWLRTFTFGDGLLDLRHVAGDAVAARAAARVMRVLLDAWRMRAVRRVRTVTGQAQVACGFEQDRRCWAVPCESWQLKHVTPRRYIRLCTKSLPCMRFLCAVPSAKCVNVVSPSLCSSSSQKSLRLAALMEADRPVEVSAPRSDSCSGCPLRVTLDARVVRADEIELRRIDDVRGGGLGDMLAARAVASLAADIPLGDRVGLHVVVDGMAAVAQRSGRPLHVVRGIVRHPPIGIGLHEVRPPDLVGDVPLRRQREVVVADLREVALLPLRCRTRTRCRRRVNVSSGSGLVRSGMTASGCCFGSVTTFAIRVFAQRS